MSDKNDVALAIKSESLGYLLSCLEWEDEQLEKQVNKLLNETTETYVDPSGSTLFIWRDINWSETYPHIDYLYKIFDSLDDYDYYFIKLDKVDTDAEFKGNYVPNPFIICISIELSYDKE